MEGGVIDGAIIGLGAGVFAVFAGGGAFDALTRKPGSKKMLRGVFWFAFGLIGMGAIFWFAMTR